jgi:type II secretory pathway pseudopilin PulG
MKIQPPTARRLRGTGAFSLVEVIISMGVLGLAVSILFNGLTTGFFTIRMARENLRATQIMLEKAETLRLYSWNQITNTTYIKREFTVPYDPNSTNGKGAIYEGTIEIEPADMSADYSDDLKLVTIRVAWKTGGLSRSREFRSLVSRHGMQDYIYGL